MTSHPDQPGPLPQDSPARIEFRSCLKDLRSSKPREWQASRTLVAAENLVATLQRLSEAIRISTLAPEIREPLLAWLLPAAQESAIPDPDSDLLKRLTGFPRAKALRALCVHFGLTDLSDRSTAAPPWTTDHVEPFLRSHTNPFDLLLEVEAPSLLDLGAGDLSFVHELTAQLVNLSAEALAAARDSQRVAVAENQEVMGEAWEQTLNLAGEYQNVTADPQAYVRWRDVEARSLGMLVDALGKAVTMLGIPPQELWARIADAMGVSQQELESWKAAAQAGNAFAQLNETLNRQAAEI